VRQIRMLQTQQRPDQRQVDGNVRRGCSGDHAALRSRYSAKLTPEPPISLGMSLNFGLPS
jgi:hypothetical protein